MQSSTTVVVQRHSQGAEFQRWQAVQCSRRSQAVQCFVKVVGCVEFDDRRSAASSQGTEFQRSQAVQCFATFAGGAVFRGSMC